jgi:enoyl-CoA hydratase/carnithine racemase
MLAAPMKLDDYQEAFHFAAVTRSTDRVLTVRFHTDDGPMVWDEEVHRRLPDLLHAIATDRQTRVVVLAGSGDEFIHYPKENDRWMTGGLMPAHGFDKTFAEARRIIEYLIDIEVPVIAAVNGPAHAHAEIALLSDIVIAADTASFADTPHFPSGLAPGDGIQTVLTALLGPNRARYHMLTGTPITPAQALDWGLVAEQLPAHQVLARAQELASQFAAKNPLVLRYTRQIFMQPFRLAFAQLLVHGMALENVGALSYRDWNETKPR